MLQIQIKLRRVHRAKFELQLLPYCLNERTFIEQSKFAEMYCIGM
jgi:hypothetical protein